MVRPADSPKKSQSPRKEGGAQGEDSDEYDSGLDSDDSEEDDDDEKEEDNVGLGLLVSGELAPEDDEDDEAWTPQDENEDDEEESDGEQEAPLEGTSVAKGSNEVSADSHGRKRGRDEDEDIETAGGTADKRMKEL